MRRTVGLLRYHLAGVVALVLVTTLFLGARLPTSSAAESRDLADGYRFRAMSIALPGGHPQQTIRKVNQRYTDIDAWISSVGSGIAMNDIDGDGLANDLCVTDPRTDQVTVTPTPDSTDRYAPFVLRPDPLPMRVAMAPMGCVPGDFNEDGRMDLLVYLWGRTPIVYLAKAGGTALSQASYQPTELVPGPRGEYAGPQWNTNAAAVDDFDGDGHLDIFIGNYFPHGPVLDDQVDGGVEMNHSMSNGLNGGEDYFFRWTSATAGADPAVTFERVDDVLPRKASKGWALAAGANDLDGDLRPELYLAHDFGPDRMLHNRSVPGRIEFELVESARSAALVPKSKRVGRDSFKGMGVDFGDLDRDGLYDMYVSNITTSFGIEESHFAFINAARDQQDLRRHFTAGRAPFDERSAPLGLAWSGWGWDVKMADFNNSGELAVAQATGFVKGEVNRWPQLQELATANDELLDNPLWWPNVRAGDDIGGSQRMHFFVKDDDGRYVDLGEELGLAVPVPTRGIATGDSDGDGRLDMAVARQWDAPVFYRNESPEPGTFLGLRLTHAPAEAGDAGSPAVGAQAVATTADGRKFVTRVDGGSGHSGKRSHEAHVGLGPDVTGPVSVDLCWRDRTGEMRKQTLRLEPGWHRIQLTDQAQKG
ncbi:RNA-binding protein [Actinoplanes sp. ATCC 53533]|uniref:CRTAC1 family protein n=1 Tax=Actinoplanes sp. ATCC 53533 TaxID=1288362 RepID=UPI000F7B9BB1|nr:CRTAC1 family protein [Actinoplanes sp. ATCC 53533]RSM47503.1 RNA-binding protein [Actinoplanes sp. ATCC 53533]